MKSTEHFKNAIKAYLEQQAEDDELFAVSFNNPQKTIDQCITYILNTVKKSGCNGFTDDEVYSMALHFYQEKDIEAGSPIDCQVVINHTIELTSEEKEQARKDAIQRVQDEAYSRMKQPLRKPQTKQAIVNIVNNQLNLFAE